MSTGPAGSTGAACPRRPEVRARGDAAHNAQTIAYDTDADGDDDRLVFHELVSGPLNAVRAGARRQDQLDPAANPTSLFGAGGLFNFNYVRIARQADGKVHLIADVRNEAGLPLAGSLLDLTPR